MKKLLWYGLLGQLLLASCASTHHLPPTPAPVEAPASVTFDSAQVRGLMATPNLLPLVLVTPRPTLLDQVLHRTPAPVAYQAVPGKLKNSTVNVYYAAGNQTNSTTTTAKNGRTVVGDGASNAEASKKAGPITQAAPGAAVHVATAAHAQAGDGNIEADKKAGPVTRAAPGADVHVASSQKGPAQAGDGNHATTSSGWPWWLWLLIAVGVIAGIYKVYKKFTPT